MNSKLTYSYFLLVASLMVLALWPGQASSSNTPFMPLSVFDRDRHDIERTFNRIFSSVLNPIIPHTGGRGLVWMPSVDAYETDKDLVINAELPGIPKEKVKLDIQDGNLVISGDHTRAEEFAHDNAFIVERQYGAFKRAIPLPANVNTDDIKARYENGVLQVTIPKSGVEAQKTIMIE